MSSPLNKALNINQDYQSFVKEQVLNITETLTKVMEGDFTQVVQTEDADDTFGYLCAMINISIKVAQNSQMDLREKILELKETTISKNILLSYLHNSPDFVFISRIDDFGFTEVNDRACKFYGYSREEFLKMQIFDIEVIPPAKEQVRALYDNSEIGEPMELFGMNKKKDGTEFPVNVRFTKTNNQLVIANVRDITQQIKTNQDLESKSRKLRNLAQHLVDVRENERMGISREIHDEFGQSLTALKFDLYWIKNHLSQSQKDVREKAQSTLNMVDTLIKTAQNITSKLRPGILDDLGLSAGIEWHAEEFEKRTGITIDLKNKIEGSEINNDVGIPVFRIFQELLTNVIRHASATRVKVSLANSNNQLKITVSDNGKGITREQISSDHSFGIIGMNERIMALKGDIIYDGVEGKGTRVKIKIPLNQ